MNRPLTVDLFVEDRAHEAFLEALLRRLGGETGRAIRCRVRAARGGHGRALSELGLYQRSVLKALGGMSLPDMLVVGIDANCRAHQHARKEVLDRIEAPFAGRCAVACPDPHVEIWYLADPASFQRTLGVRPSLRKGKCERNYYKSALAAAVTESGHVSTLGGIEFAAEIVEAMDLYRAGRRHRSLAMAIADIRRLLNPPV